MGRPKYVLPDNFNEVTTSYLRREIKCSDAARLLNMARGTFFKYVHIK